MELDILQIAPKVNHHGYLQVTALSRQNYCWHIQRHAYWYDNVMRLSRLFRALLFWKHSSRLVIWECFSIVYNLIWYNYCCRRHTMHGNMVFSTHYILGNPQQRGGFLVCCVNTIINRASTLLVQSKPSVYHVSFICSPENIDK